MNSSLRVASDSISASISLAVLIYCCTLNIPVNVAREVKVKLLHLENQTFEAYYYGIREFEYQNLLIGVVFISNTVRDLVPFILEIAIYIILVMETKKYVKKRRPIIGTSKKFDKDKIEKPVAIVAAV